jgi:hypothetical protein
MKKYSFLFFTVLILAFTQVQAQSNGVSDGLKVSTNKKQLVNAKTGLPVFILATTAWNINSLNYQEIDTLLKSISSNGFNAVMFTLNFYPQANEANVYGQCAYIGEDKTELNPAYFSYCDSIVNLCLSYQIYPMIYTMWGGEKAGTMNTYTAQQLYTLGKKIGIKFKNERNVILVAGGESSPPYVDTTRVNAMGRGLMEGCQHQNLVSVHPTSMHSNSDFFAQSTWLDFYMTHGKSNLSGIDYDFTKAVVKDYQLKPSKPTMVVEHRYESGVNENPSIQRRTLYLSVFAGAFGYAYGHNALWQMTPHTAQQWMLKSWAAGVDDWKEALNTPAVKQLAYIKPLLYVHPEPCQSILLKGDGNRIADKVQVMTFRDKKNKVIGILAYLSAPKAITLNTEIIDSKKLNTYWFNPSNGVMEVISKRLKNTGKFTNEIPLKHQDWVLIIEDSKNKNGLKLNSHNEK